MSVVVVGASLAGLRGAEALRLAGYEGGLTIVGDEPHWPYDRPPLSKHVLSGEIAAGATSLPSQTALRAKWLLGQAVVGLDRAARTVRLADGASLPYDRLLIATGARARPLIGADAFENVYSLRRREDAAALREALRRKPGRVLIVGAGLIGCEAASCCRSLGLPVTLVDPNAAPLSHALGASVGRTIAALATEAGVDFRPRTRVERLEGERGRVRRAVLAGGTSVEVDLVITALGAVRDVGWLADAGLAADPGGVTCDAACRALTQDGEASPDIYVAGDIARWPSALFGRLLAVEHWGNAVEQAGHAARNMLAAPDRQRPYQHLPAFWSSQFGVNVKSVGMVDGADEVAVVRGSRSSRRFLAVYGRAGRTVGAVSFDEARWLPAYAERIEAGAAFPPIVGGTDQPSPETFAPELPPAREERPHG